MMVVALAGICGLSAAVGVTRLQGKVIGPPKLDTVPVVVAAANIPRGERLSEELLQIRDWPKKLAPPGAITTIEEAIDRTVITPIVQNEPLLDTKIAAIDAGRGMAALVKPGMRAFTILTPTVASGVAGFILPGNKVDVLLTVTSRGLNDATGGASTTTLLQNVEILAVDQQLDAPAENKMDAEQLRSVTLLVMPEQAGKLTLAQNKGTLHLSLRGDDDNLSVNASLVTLKDLRFEQEGPLQALQEMLRGADDPDAPKTAPVIKPVELTIRTLRGSHGGSVRLRPSGDVVEAQTDAVN